MMYLRRLRDRFLIWHYRWWRDRQLPPGFQARWESAHNRWTATFIATGDAYLAFGCGEISEAEMEELEASAHAERRVVASEIAALEVERRRYLA